MIKKYKGAKSQFNNPERDTEYMVVKFHFGKILTGNEKFEIKSVIPLL
jgi:hypothetical protein